jgi:hypothetical protein
MKKDIKDKLTDELKEQIASERQVVYILVELRKLMELSKEKGGGYFALNFYCSWAVHTEMDQNGAANIVKRFDDFQRIMDFVDSTAVDGVSDLPPEDITKLKELEGTLQLQKFRSQLENYLAKEALPNNLTTTTETWHNFLKYYLRVIEDCPLVCIAPLEHVQKVVIKVMDVQEAAFTDYKIMIRWEWTPVGKPDETISKVTHFSA